MMGRLVCWREPTPQEIARWSKRDWALWGLSHGLRAVVGGIVAGTLFIGTLLAVYVIVRAVV